MVFSYQSTTLTRFFVPARAAVSPLGSQCTLIFVPAVVVPSCAFVYCPTAHAIMYGGASASIDAGYTAVFPAGTLSRFSVNVVPSAGCEWQGNRLPQKYGHTTVEPPG